MPSVYRARWVLPIAQPPIEHGWVAVDRGRITAVGGPGHAPPAEPRRIDGVILPGLVNAHTHLELSFLHERIPHAPRFGVWVRGVMDARRGYPDPADPVILDAAARAILDARSTGTALFGDVSNTLVTAPLLRDHGLAAQVFHELTGFTEQDPEARVRHARARADAAAGGDVRVSVAPHAPYSVSSALFKAICADIDRHRDAVSSVHLGESAEEVELLRQGTGDIRRVLEDLGRWPGDWQPPRVGPVEYLDGLGLLHPRILAVHGVQFGESDLARLRASHVTVVSCPRSNVYVGVGSPPLARFYDSGVDVALGTDSLASVADLNMFSELQEARRIAPGVPARRLLASVTMIAARALGFGGEFGSIEAGKRAALISVDLSSGCPDVEECLVSGVLPGAVRWLCGGDVQ